MQTSLQLEKDCILFSALNTNFSDRITFQIILKIH